MVVDASALAAILFGEPEQLQFIEIIEAADSRRLSAATFVEASIIVESRLGAAGLHDLDRFLVSAEIELLMVDEEQARIARAAFSRFGKGRHAARLNFGDCFAYALAKTLGEPLLCKGADFARTDVALATSPA
jgi:ribonuclease VapC